MTSVCVGERSIEKNDLGPECDHSEEQVEASKESIRPDAWGSLMPHPDFSRQYRSQIAKKRDESKRKQGVK